jgi:hypothetical protein
MKNILLLGGLLIFGSQVSGQQLTNIKSGGATKSIQSKWSSLLNQKKVNSEKRDAAFANERVKIDSLNKKGIDSLIDLIIDSIIVEMEGEPDLTISGVGGVSNLESIDKAGGNFSICATFKLGRNKRVGKTYWIDPGFLYLAFNTRTHSSSDTSSFARSLLFPEISKRDFIIGTFFRFRHARTNWVIKPLAEFSLNRYNTGAADSVTSLRTESYLFGFKFSKEQRFNLGQGASYMAGFQLFPYYNLIHIQEKNEKYLPPGVLLPRSLHTFGMQAVLQVSGLQLFANAKYMLSNTKAAGIDDLTGMTYTIGTVINVDILEFNLGN